MNGTCSCATGWTLEQARVRVRVVLRRRRRLRLSLMVMVRVGARPVTGPGTFNISLG